MDSEIPFAAELRRSLIEADPPPPSADAAANRAFAMRSPVVPADDSDEQPVGVRSLAGRSVVRVAGPGHTLAWTVDRGRITGTVQPSPARLRCRTASTSKDLVLDDISGAFEAPLPGEPWRLEVEHDADTSWASEWQSPRVS